jgi:hypothetical protein
METAILMDSNLMVAMVVVITVSEAMIIITVVAGRVRVDIMLQAQRQ